MAIIRDFESLNRPTTPLSPPELTPVFTPIAPLTPSLRDPIAPPAFTPVLPDQIRLVPDRDAALERDAWTQNLLDPSRALEGLDVTRFQIPLDVPPPTFADLDDLSGIHRFLPSVNPDLFVDTIKDPSRRTDEDRRLIDGIAEDLIDKNTSWGDLDETGMGRDMAQRLKWKQPYVVNRAFDMLSDSDRDDVAVATAKNLTDADLREVAADPEGLALLRRMAGDLNSGYVGEEEARQAQRIGQAIHPKHSRLLDDSMPAEVQQALRNAGATQQKVADGKGEIVYDEYSVVIDKMPPGVTPEQFLRRMARDLNGTVNNGDFNGKNEFARRVTDRDPRPGDIYDININGPDDGAVVLRDMDDHQFTFSTISEPANGEHPEYGNREFGFERQQDGSIRFYTRGVSRPSNFVPGDHGLVVRAVGGPQQQTSWTALVTGIGDTIAREGGQVRAGSIQKTFGPQ